MKVLPGFFIVVLCCLGCRDQPARASKPSADGFNSLSVRHASGFRAERDAAGIITLTVLSPWPQAEKDYTYLLVPKEQLSYSSFDKDAYDAIIGVPVSSIVLTSTTHIPALESLKQISSLVGFPGLDYISSEQTRSRIATGKVKELGANDRLNTEMVLNLQPELVVGFGVTGIPEAYLTLENSGIPLVLNGDWMEQNPLGKAEWIKFFGLLFGQWEEAEEIFTQIETDYVAARELAASAKNRPSVISGALYRDIWYLPGGGSWAAKFLEDANAAYIWADNNETGSLSLSLESVLEKGSSADYWISPSEFTTYQAMREADVHYERFKAFKEKQVYTYAATRGAGSGLLYFELGPNRPDLILKDLIYYLHPGVIPEYEPVFYQPLK